MAPPPAKRQKRLIVLSSDEDEGAGGRYQNNGAKREEASVRPEDKVNSSCSLPTRSRTKPRATAPKPRSGASHGSTPSSSPEKPRKKLKAESKSQKAGSLYTFFNAATQSQRVNGRSDSAPLEVDAEEKDFIQDDPLDEELVPVQGRLGKSEGIDGKRTGRRKSSAPNGTAAHNETYPNASQRFLMPTQPAQTGFAKHLSGKTDKEDLRPWWERYAPASLEELAVHKRKVSDVRNWLDDAFHGRSRKVQHSSTCTATTHTDCLQEALGTQRPFWHRENCNHLNPSQSHAVRNFGVEEPSWPGFFIRRLPVHVYTI